MLKTVTLAEAQKLPRWRRPIVLLFLMAFAMPIAFNTWSALLNNFVIEVANFDGSTLDCCTRCAKYLDFWPLV